MLSLGKTQNYCKSSSVRQLFENFLSSSYRDTSKVPEKGKLDARRVGGCLGGEFTLEEMAERMPGDIKVGPISRYMSLLNVYYTIACSNKTDGHNINVQHYEIVYVNYGRVILEHRALLKMRQGKIMSLTKITMFG